ncbi:hypothetical protein AB0878_36780 [Amycolatopsis sp. NPDC047767]|uniref:hypothetical protein n=1 Tax=Amycolatopsis sp. NPDC047767 TaxID=3156765 RepID=UPI003455520E
MGRVVQRHPYSRVAPQEILSEAFGRPAAETASTVRDFNVVDGAVARIRGVEADLAKWDTDDRGYADVPVTKPLTELQIARRLPTLGIALGDHRPHVRGKIREYVSL